MTLTPNLRRPRRNRRSPSIRSLTQETRLHPSDFVVPLFVLEGEQVREEVPSMPGVYRQSLDLTIQHVRHLSEQGIQAIDLFAVVPMERKDSMGSEACRPGNLLQRACQAIKAACPEICIMVDVALDPFTSHGHDGVLDSCGNIVNDETIHRLVEMSLGLAKNGADVIAPSDMMDGRVYSIRQELDREGFDQVGILAYTAKYASAFYGPFRDALQSAPKSGDKKTYQMNPSNRREALVEARLDEAEGADMLLVKPALPYLDVLSDIKKSSDLPVGAYHVSGEYAMVMAAAERGWVRAEDVFYESLLSIKRAGADFIFTYASPLVLPML